MKNNTNTTLLVQDFLNTHSLEALKSMHGVNYKICNGYKVGLNYSQIDAKNKDPLAQQCRGLILRKEDGTDIVSGHTLGNTIILAHPFDRFFNYGQDCAAPVDFSSPKTSFFEKLDGTCTILYFDDTKHVWHVATRAVPEADQVIDGWEEYTFRTLFERALTETTGKSFESFVTNLNTENTYIFELTTPSNRVVILHKEYRVTLIGVRNNYSGTENNAAEVALKMGVPSAKSFRFGSVVELIGFVSSRNPGEHEGVVVCDENFNRVKVKNAGYLALGRIQDKVCNSVYSLLSIVLDGKLDDVAPIIPEHVLRKGEALQENIKRLSSKVDSQYEECLAVADCISIDRSNHEAKKTFALEAIARNAWLPALISIYSGKAKNFYDWVNTQRNSVEVQEKSTKLSVWPQSFLKNLYKQSAS